MRTIEFNGRKKKLTDAGVKNLPIPESGQETWWDTEVPLLGVRITPRGTKTFTQLYRINGRNRRINFGRYPIIGLAEAREKARNVLRAVSNGVDPALEKQKQRQSFQSDEFASLVDQYIATYAREHTIRWKETRRLLDREFVPHWKGQSVKQITKSDVRHIVLNIKDRGAPSAANHAFAAIRGFFNWAVENGDLQQSPCARLKAPSKNRKRDRVVDDSELQSIIAGAGQIGFPFGDIVRLLILTAQRREEVASMKWADLDLEKGEWTIPAASNKSGRAHVVPLTRSAAGVIASISRADSAHVFPAVGNPTNPFSGYSKSKKRLDQLCGVPEWTLHDLRRTAATGMAKNKVPIHVIEKVLNHKEGTLKSVAGVYNRFGYLPEMREALEAWEKHVIGLSASAI